MGVSEQCKQAMIANGVVMRDGRPASAELLSKDAIKIIFVEADENGDYPTDFEKPARSPINLGHPAISPSAFPKEFDMQKIVKEAMGYWYEGEVEFVQNYDEADVVIYAYQGDINMGTSTVPDNDHPVFYRGSSNIPMIGVNTVNFSGYIYTSKEVQETLRHEFGHGIVGIVHPDQVFRYSEEGELESCMVDPEVELWLAETPAIMGPSQTPTETWYDRGTKDLAKDGADPVANLSSPFWFK